MKHLPDGGDVAPQEDGDRSVAVGDHVVEEPPAGRGTAVELLGQQLDQLDDVELLLGVDERLEEEGGGQLGRLRLCVISRIFVKLKIFGHTLADKRVMSPAAPSWLWLRVIGRKLTICHMKLK